MSMEQKQYKEMFNEIKLSEDKKKSIEEAMMESGRVRRRFSARKLVIITACMVAVLSCVCMAAPYIARSVQELLEERGEVITYESRGEGIPNKVTADTREITMLVDGEPFKWEIDAEQFADENGNVDLIALCDDIFLNFSEYRNKIHDDEGKMHSGCSMKNDTDLEGNLYIEVWTDDDPRNSEGWTYMQDKGPWCLMVPKNVTFAEGVELIDCGNGNMGIPLPENFKKGDVLFFDFTYNGEEYTVAAMGDHGVEIVKKKAGTDK